MNGEKRSILLVGRPAEELLHIQRTLRESAAGYALYHSAETEEAFRRLEAARFDFCFFDAASANGGFREFIPNVARRASDAPAVILFGVEDDAQGSALLRQGACDYLLRGRVDVATLSRSIRLVAERRAAETALALSNERYHRLLCSVTDYTYTVFLENGRAVSSRHGPGCAAVTGYTAGEYEADPHLWYRMICDEDRDAVLQMSSQIIAGMTPPPLEHRIIHRDGSTRWIKNTPVPRCDRDGRLIAYDGLVTDITERKLAEENLRHAAYHDSLTGLPNREVFSDRLQQSMVQTRRYSAMLAVMFLDLDRFKEINDTLGHRAGDLLLMNVARRLKGCVWETDTVARCGGDEFLLLFPGIRQARDAAVIARKVHNALAEPHLLKDQELIVTATIGISLSPDDGDDAETLIKFADVAMFKAKSEGGGSYRFYAHSMNAEAHRRLILETHLRKALEREEFVLHYQPQLNLATERIVGIEALLRWRHPLFGLLPPREFIPVAEDTGLIIPIGEWVMEKACAQSRRWQEAGYGPLRVAINLSMRQFHQNDVTRMVSAALEKSGLHAPLLDLELTESVIMRDAVQTIETLRQLKSLGVSLTIDDFGTGYSSLRYLNDLPLNALKLDQSFVAGLSENGGNEAISKTIIALARNMKLRVIAEGVETAEQMERLRGLGCDEVQGYLFGTPLPAEDFGRIMKERAEAGTPS